MSWFSPILLTRDDSNPYSLPSGAAFGASFGSADGAAPRAGRSAGLGSAQAGGRWAWADAPARPQTAATTTVDVRAAEREGACLRAPVDLLSRMSEAARALGRSESEIWVEAARDWLNRHELALATAPAAPAPAPAPEVSRRMTRVWDDIDVLLSDLRAPLAQPSREGAPAA